MKKLQLITKMYRQINIIIFVLCLVVDANIIYSNDFSFTMKLPSSLAVLLTTFFTFYIMDRQLDKWMKFIFISLPGCVIRDIATIIIYVYINEQIHIPLMIINNLLLTLCTANVLYI